MITMATPLCVVKTILSLSFLSSTGDFCSSLVRSGLDAREPLRSQLISALNFSASWGSNFWQTDCIDVGFLVLLHNLVFLIRETPGPWTMGC